MLLASAVVDGDPIAAAAAAALRHNGDDAAGIRRLRRGAKFSYRDARGASVRDATTLSRIRALAIPPAWTDVWISADARGHIQATGRDARGRKQYRYHAQWREVRDAAKYTRLVAFCTALPKLRASVARDLACSCLCKAKVIASVVALMERAQLRIGNEEYARDNGSYGATTLRDRHAKIHGDTLELAFRGKSGIARRVRITDRRLVRVVRRCRELPGQRLFQYVDGDAVHPITSSDVNDYLREVAGAEFTAKDFRTWHGSVHALELWAAECELDAGSRRRPTELLTDVAKRLRNTVAVCKKAYVHPRVLEALLALSGASAPVSKRVPRRAGLSSAERRLLAFLRPR